MLKSKRLSQDHNRLKKMPPNAASKTIRHHSAQDSRDVIAESTSDSESSDQDEPEEKPRLSVDDGQKSISCSPEEVVYPSIPPGATSLEDKDNNNSEKSLPTPAEDESLQRLSRSRTPSPVKKSQSFKAQSQVASSKAALEAQTTHITTDSIDSHGSYRDASRPGAATRSSYIEKSRPRDPTPPQPSLTQRIGRVNQVFFGKPTKQPGHTSHSSLERELERLNTALGNKDFQIQQSEAKRKDLERKNKDLQYSLAMAEEARDDIIRKQQEENFKQINTGRWLPQEESKIKGDLDRLKRSMKSWSKDCSVNNMTPLQSLMKGTDEEVALTQCLSDVVRLDEGCLPPGLATSKSPSLLLNALLAHDIYKTIFGNPFFFLRDQLDYEPPRLPPDEKFNEMYQWMLSANDREAHIWRSQTLRLLYPPLRESSSKAEIEVHSRIDAQIARVSQWHAERFVDGPARHLIHSDDEGQFSQRVIAIYKQAADLSYQLWARRTTIRCITLREMGPLAAFALESPYMEPHTLVRYDDHPDQLFGRPFTVVVHPIVEALGTDEGEGYGENGRVWAKAVVWLDSRIDSRRR